MIQLLLRYIILLTPIVWINKITSDAKPVAKCVSRNLLVCEKSATPLSSLMKMSSGQIRSNSIMREEFSHSVRDTADFVFVF